MKFKKVLSLALAFVLSLPFVFFLPLNLVSALDSAWLTPSDSFVKGSSVSNSSFNTTLLSLQSLFDRNHINYNNYYIVVSDSSVSTDKHAFMFPKGNESLANYNFSSTFSGLTYNVYTGDNIYVIADDFSGVSLFANSYQSTKFGLCMDSIGYYGCQFSNMSLTNVYTSSSFIYFSTLNLSLLPEDAPPFQPDYNSYQLTGFIVGSDTSMEAFYQWIIDNNKLSELPSYIVSSKLKSLLDFYHNYGGSLTGFIHYLPQWLSYVSLPSQTSENANILKNKLDALYSEFINQYTVMLTLGKSANAAHHRNAINTKTDDSDLTLVTDVANDDVITSILRDILRGVIAISTNIYNCSNAIIEKLDGLSFTTTVVNNGGVPSGTDLSPLLSKMDDIIDKLESDTVSVEIDQTTLDNTDDFFDGWNAEFSDALDDKFPVAGQLSILFTDFWEKCGIDVDGDGETFEFYSPQSLTSRSVSSSVDNDIVSDFLDQFPDSDSAFLDDASYNGVPDLSVNIGGSDVSIFDFRVYAKYREQIHFIISFVIWSLYLLHLYKSLPTIIGHVADVTDSIRNY